MIVQLIKVYEQELRDNLRMEGEFNKESEKKYLSVVSLFRITKENLRTICMAANEGLSNEKLELKIL